MQVEPGLIAMVNRPVGLTAGYACFTQLQKPAGTGTAIITGTAIPRQRNEAVKAMLASPQFKWLLFVDDDQTFPPDALTRLLGHHRPIVGAVITGKYPPYEPWFFFNENGALRRATCKDAAGSRVIEVGAVGTGFMLIRRNVLEAIGEPWFEGGKLGSEGVGEDIYFCLKARQAGYRAFVDTGLKVGHLTVVSVLLDDNGEPHLTHDRFMRRETIK